MKVINSRAIHFLTALLLPLIFCGAAGFAQQQENEYPDPATRFVDYVDVTVSRDMEFPPPKGAIVCVGSSSMRMWEPDLDRDLYPLTLVKRGFGGSNFADALYYIDELVLRHEPRAVLVYEGDNDVGGSRVHPERVMDMAEKFIELIHRRLPDCRIYFISPKPSPRRADVWPEMDAFNDLLKAKCERDDRLFYLDVSAVMMNAQGEVDPALFKQDELHMNRAGYRLWRSVVRPVLIENELPFEAYSHPRLVKLWEVSEGIHTPESVYYHSPEDVLFVSNIGNGVPRDRDGDGYISKLSRDGRVIDAQWVTGLNAPKGLAVHGSYLYVSDIDELVRINLADGRISRRYPARGALLLNDVAADHRGNILVGDSSEENSVLYRLEKGQLQVWLDAPTIPRPNGLSFEDGYLLTGSVQDYKLSRIDILSREITMIADTGMRIDGLEPLGNGRYLTSDWEGRICYIDPTGAVQVIQDTREQNINAADFEYIATGKMLVVPTFFDNRIVAYSVVYE